MKKSLITLALLAPLTFGQTQKVAPAGAAYGLNANITFGGNNYLTIESSTDTLSDPIVAEIQSIRPGTFLGIEYKGIAADSATVGYTISIQSRTCQNPVTGTLCPDQWLMPRFRFFQNGSRFQDTLRVNLIPEDTTQVGHYTLIPTGNQWRLRVKGSGASDVYANFWKLVGY